MSGLTLRQLGADRAARGVVPPPALLQVAGPAGEAAAAVALVRPPLALVDVAVVAEQHPRPLAPPRHPLALVVAAVSVAHPPPAVPPAAGTISQKMYYGHKQTLVGIDIRQLPQSATEQCPIVV